MDFLKNIPIDIPLNPASGIEAKPGQIVSMSLTKSEHVQITIFAFPDNEGISEESYFGDTMYYVLEGEMPLSRGSDNIIIKQGECLAVPANTLHAIGGQKSFKLLQITINQS